MSQQAKILLVDDDPDFVIATRAVLESVPYEVVVARDGEEGLTAARREMPDLILLDIIMPKLDGFEVCQRLKGDSLLGDIPIIMITSFAERYMETSLALSQGLALESDDFVDKPIHPAELLVRVDKQLRRRGAAVG